jgi:hypothetical protein
MAVFFKTRVARKAHERVGRVGGCDACAGTIHPGEHYELQVFAPDPEFGIGWTSSKFHWPPGDCLVDHADRWNVEHPIGTPVRYWTGVREGEGRESKTRTVAQLLSGRTPVVWVEDHGSCIALTHVEPLAGEGA